MKRLFQKKRAIWTISIGLCGVLYCASIGPSYALLRKNRLSQGTFSSIYRPILYFADHSSFCENVLYDYLSMWYSDEKNLNQWVKELGGK